MSTRDAANTRSSGGCWVGIAGLLCAAALLGVLLVRAGHVAVREAQSMVRGEDVEREAKRIAAALEAWRCDHGGFPASLQELTRAEEGWEPVLTAIPPIPGSEETPWGYDPTTGAITDPSGAWGGAAEPRAASGSAGDLEQGPLPPVRGPLWGTESRDPYTVPRPRGKHRWMFVYVFRTSDESLPSDLAALRSGLPGDAEAVGLLVAAKPGEADLPRDAAGLTSLVPVLDLRAGSTALSEGLAIRQTPVLLLCDRDLRLRARMGGAVEEASPGKLISAAEDHDRAIRLGRGA